VAHNGGRYQTQLGLPGFEGQWPFKNKIKMSSIWSASRPDAANINANGYPTSAIGTPELVISDEGNTFQSGQRVLAWDGTATFTISGASVASGSLSGTNGRAVLNLSTDTSPKNITLTLTATDGTLDNMRWLHINDEASYNAQKLAYPNKEPFNPKFIEVTQGLNIGSFRFLDAQLGNISNVCTAAHRMPVSHFSYVVSHFPPSAYATLTSGSSSTMTATKTGFALVDGATVILDLGTAAISGTPTLNIEATGAKLIKTPSGVTWTKADTTGSPRRGAFTYVAILDRWVTTAIDFDDGIIAGWPWEVMLDLCNILNCHGHFVPPFLTVDTPSDYMPAFATMAASTLNPGLKAFWEIWPNECWNTAFYGTKHAEQIGTARWSAASIDDACGRWGSLLGASISSIYGGDTSRHALLGGVFTITAPDNVAGANTLRRFESTRHVSVNGGTPAKNYITHVCPHNYWTTMKAFAGTVGTSAEMYLRGVAYVAAARDWFNGDAATKQSLIDAQFDEAQVEAWMVSEADTRIARWNAVAQHYGIGVIPYEGGYYPGDINSDPTHGFDNITLGNPTIIVVNKINATQAHAFQPTSTSGMRARFRSTASGLGLTSTTQLNGNTYDVLSVTDTEIRLDVDSTSFTPFVPGDGNSGAFSAIANAGIKGIVYDGYGNTGNQTLSAFQEATKASPYILYATQKSLQRLAAGGWLYPSDFFLFGYSPNVKSLNQWSKYNYLYSTPNKQVDAMTLFNNRLRRKRLGATS
jgi:hypothetical protein